MPKKFLHNLRIQALGALHDHSHQCPHRRLFSGAVILERLGIFREDGVDGGVDGGVVGELEEAEGASEFLR